MHLYLQFEELLDQLLELATILEVQADDLLPKVRMIFLMKMKKIITHTKTKTEFQVTEATIFSKRPKTSAEEKVKAFDIEMNKDLKA